MCKTTCLGCGKKIEECVCQYLGKNLLNHPCNITGSPITFPPNGTGDYWRITYSKPDTEIDDLHETLTSMRNRIDVLLELNEHDDLAHTIPTVLEDLYEDCQRLVEDYAFDN